jgi:hypothetical protein
MVRARSSETWRMDLSLLQKERTWLCKQVVHVCELFCQEFLLELPDLRGVDFLLFQELLFVDPVLLGLVAASAGHREQLKKEDKPIFAGSNVAEQKLEVICGGKVVSCPFHCLSNHLNIITQDWSVGDESGLGRFKLVKESKLGEIEFYF